ncbi:hypothetical protein GCM10009122_56030 [Fulvivirga kasyanovii]|uniref:Sulfotransferase n=1 Tax=Fulvivirga kasyanovii TaxID=396812 RepID=A0ABW9RLC3_9BACT|nr:sulfotransferase [Fulvivirga kasyanovii]MTI24627.1 sulfotransferase [Fulvivirga kasyanovii]
MQFIFIGGAPRSGTTLLLNLLESHPDIVGFPFEHKTFEQYFWHNGDINYLRENFIKNSREGQQAILSSEYLINEYVRKIRGYYGKEFSVDIDPKLFLATYLNRLSISCGSLQDVFDGLAQGILDSNSFALSKKERLEYFCFKQPYFTELFAKETSKELPEARFIHVVRNPIARYTSAKKRFLDIYGHAKNPVHINRQNTVFAHAEVDVTSYELALKNQRNIGGQRYLIVKYEELVSNVDVTMNKISKWLKLTPHYGWKTSRLGEEADAGSSYVTRRGVDEAAASRNEQYLRITNQAEREYHQYLLTKSKIGKLYGIESHVNTKMLIRFVLNFFYKESLGQYVYRLLTVFNNIRVLSFGSKALPERVKKKNAGLSGAI